MLLLALVLPALAFAEPQQQELGAGDAQGTGDDQLLGDDQQAAAEELGEGDEGEAAGQEASEDADSGTTAYASDEGTSGIADQPSEQEPGAFAPTSLSDEIDISTYIGPVADSRYPLDLKALKDAGINEGTLVVEGTAANKMFVRITDSSIAGAPDSVQGSYNILLGEWGGVEIMASAGVLNSINEISNKANIANILPVFTYTSVSDISINGGSGVLKLNPVIKLASPYTPTTDLSRKLGIVAHGAGTVVNSLYVNNVKVENYDQAYEGGYSYGSFIGAQKSARIAQFTLGNFSMTYNQAQVGVIAGSAYNAVINNYDVVGTVELQGNGWNSSHYCPLSLVGSGSGNLGYFVIASSAKILVSNGATNDQSAVAIGPSRGSCVSLTAQQGSEIRFTNYNFRNTGASLVFVGGKVIGTTLLQGKIDIETVTGQTDCFIGSYQPDAPMSRLMIGSTADIRIKTKDYLGPAIGVSGGSGSQSLSELIVEDGATISIETTKPYSIKRYFAVDMAFGNNEYGRPIGSIKIGATRQEDGSYVVQPGASSTTISLKGLRCISFGNTTLNANVYAETLAADSDFYGVAANSPYTFKTTIVGGNYLLQKPGAALTHIPFNVNLTSNYDPKKLSAEAYNQHNERLYEMLYDDASLSLPFIYDVPAARTGGTVIPAYDYVAPASFATGVDLRYKSIYYPKRALYGKVEVPEPGTTPRFDSTIVLGFDLPLDAAENLDKGYTVTVRQGANTYYVPLVSGSEQFEIKDGLFYLHLAKVPPLGTSLAAGDVDIVFPANSLQKTLYAPDQQLTLTRNLLEWNISQQLRAPQQFMVDFDLNGAASPEQIPAQIVTEGEPATEPADEPQLPGHIFSGWAVQDDSGLRIWDFADGVEGDMTLVATFAPDLGGITTEDDPGTTATPDDTGTTTTPDDLGTPVYAAAELVMAAAAGEAQAGGEPSAAARQSSDPLADILQGSVPMGGSETFGAWSLLSMAMGLVAIASSLGSALAAVILRRRRTGSASGAGEAGLASKAGRPGDAQGRRPASLVLVIAAIVTGMATLAAFLLLDDMAQPMAWINQNTWIVAVLFAAHAALTIIATVRGKNRASQADGGGLSPMGRPTW